uniref:Uncharacterized protein n=1 Tax=Arundo donax TaxID=35708 RepID=A0A0A8YWY3_ARUDO
MQQTIENIHHLSWPNSPDPQNYLHVKWIRRLQIIPYIIIIYIGIRLSTLYKERQSINQELGAQH